jgi:hypothetical protein
MFKTITGKTINLTNCKEIAAGGEGKILEHPTSKKKVVKVYHSPRNKDFAKHLAALSTLDSKSFVCPQEIYFNNKGEVVGFDMDYVNFNDYWLFNNLFNKSFCTSNGITSDFKIKVLAQLRSALEKIHKIDVVVGDLNMYNIFVSKAGEILFVDVDSYQTPTQPHSAVLLDEIRDWTTLSINKETDAWAYDILAFWTTTFCHPFKWVVPGNNESLEQRVKNHKSYLSPIPGIKTPALYQPPTGEVEKQFRDIFGGRRYMVDFSGSYTPVSTVINQQIHSTSLEIREIANNITHINACNNYIAIRKADGKWGLMETLIPRVTRVITEERCDQLFPSNSNNYIYVKGNILYGSKGEHIEFVQPIFYYNNGSLVAFDYGSDQQKNIDIENQAFGLSYTMTNVFTKSIIVRDAPIQNFGAKKFLNIPTGNKYSLIEVSKDVENAVYVNSYAGLEIKRKTKVEYVIAAANNILNGFFLDHFSHFAVKNNLIFVPENGYIDVYQNGSVITKLDCSMCTTDSKLYSTGSGIVLYENNIVYLLNTK